MLTLTGACLLRSAAQARCYAEGGPGARYNSFWSRFIWYSLVGNAVAALSFAAGLAGLF